MRLPFSIDIKLPTLSRYISLPSFFTGLPQQVHPSLLYT